MSSIAPGSVSNPSLCCIFTAIWSVPLYARVSTPHQHTIGMQLRQLREFLERRRWQEVLVVEEVVSGSRRRPERDRLLDAARRREIGIIAGTRQRKRYDVLEAFPLPLLPAVTDGSPPSGAATNGTDPSASVRASSVSPASWSILEHYAK